MYKQKKYIKVTPLNPLFDEYVCEIQEKDSKFLLKTIATKRQTQFANWEKNIHQSNVEYNSIKDIISLIEFNALIKFINKEEAFLELL